MTLSSTIVSRLEKTAVDNGFDQTLTREGDWLGFASTHAPTKLWLTAYGDGLFLAAVSQPSVAKALGDHGAPFTNPLPDGAVGARGVADIPALHHLVRRAFQLSRTLPDELLHVFEKRIAGLRRATEVERLVVQRVGQDVFRAGLIEYWEARCAITGLRVVEVLRASHIKPWAVCGTDAERLDVFNGLLLAPHLDALFDRGLVTIETDGRVGLSSRISDEDRLLLGIHAPLRLRTLASAHLPYLAWHRENVCERASALLPSEAPDGR